MRKKERPALKPGDIVEAAAGRDRGRRFLVVESVDSQYVYIADGDTRRLSRAKKKKNLHLRRLAHIDDTGFLENRGGTADAAIRKILKEV